MKSKHFGSSDYEAKLAEARELADAEIIEYWDEEAYCGTPDEIAVERPLPKVIGYNKDGIPMVRRIGSGPRSDLAMRERDKSNKPRKSENNIFPCEKSA